MRQAEFFEGRRILLIAPRFFGYETKIVNHLQSLGAKVQFLDERPGNSIFIKGILRLHSVLTPLIAQRYFTKALTSFGGLQFDDVLVISPECFDEQVIRLIRQTQPSARIILYMWDSLINKGWSGSRAVTFLSGFDRTLTFDDVDAVQYGMKLRPLFYSNMVRQKEDVSPEFAFSFIGTIHSDRYRVVKDLKRCAQERGLSTFIYAFIPSKYLFWFFKWTKSEFRGSRLEEFQLSPLAYEQVLDVFHASQCIVDIEHPEQRGLTMRTLEVIGSGKHLLTTNPNIRKYAFYSPERVTVIDRHHATLPDPVPEPIVVSEEERHSLSLAGWCEEVFAVPGNPE